MKRGSGLWFPISLSRSHDIQCRPPEMVRSALIAFESCDSRPLRLIGADDMNNRVSDGSYT